MSDSDITISSISSQKTAEVAQKAEAVIFRKALDSQSEVTNQLIDGATRDTLPEGVGKLLNTVA